MKVVLADSAVKIEELLIIIGRKRRIMDSLKRITDKNFENNIMRKRIIIYRKKGIIYQGLLLEIQMLRILKRL